MTECRRHEVVYTVETKTELYNRLVPWGIAMLKLEINIPPQQIFAKSKGGAYNWRGHIILSEYGMFVCLFVCLLACLLVALYHKFKWAHLNTSWRQNVLSSEFRAMPNPRLAKGYLLEHEKVKRSLERKQLKLKHVETAGHDRQGQAAPRRYRQITHSSLVHFR